MMYDHPGAAQSYQIDFFITILMMFTPHYNPS